MGQDSETAVVPADPRCRRWCSRRRLLCACCQVCLVILALGACTYDALLARGGHLYYTPSLSLEADLRPPRALVGRQNGAFSFSLMSYNVWRFDLLTEDIFEMGWPWGPRLWRNRLPRILDEIGHIYPDILCLQEIARRSLVQFTDALAAHYDLVEDDVHDWMTPIFFKKTAFESLGSVPGVGRSRVAALKHRHSDSVVHLACVHARWTDFKRLDHQARDLAHAFNKTSESIRRWGSGVLLVAGDFNFEPIVRPCCPTAGQWQVHELTYQTTPLYDLLTTGNVSDTGLALLREQAGSNEIDDVLHSLNHSGFMPFRSAYRDVLGRELSTTYYQWDGHQSVDYIFASTRAAPVRAVAVRDGPSETFIDGWWPDGNFPSDHLPITAYFELV